MTELLSWREDWCIGIDWVDDDHREMAERLNRLADAVHRAALEPERGGEAGADGSLVLQRLDELIEHIRRHFGAEEAFLRKIAYPGYEAHRREHRIELAELVDLRRSLETEGAAGLDPEILGDVKRWYFNHVIAEDRVYAQYYRRISDDGDGS